MFWLPALVEPIRIHNAEVTVHFGPNGRPDPARRAPRAYCARRALPPIDHEPTGETGLRHVDGTVSMARAAPVGAMGDFFIIVGGAMPAMDSKGGEPGFAAFGRVEEGMDVVRRILAAPVVPGAGRGAMRGQMLEKPVRIVSARRLPESADIR